MAVVWIPILDVGSGQNIARVGEGRYPAVAVEPSIPADVIDVEVRADDEIDIVDTEPCRGRAIEEIGVEVGEHWDTRPDLVIAAAGVEQDDLVANLDHPALDARLDRIGPVIEISLADAVAGFGIAVSIEAREKQLRCQEFAAPFLDTVNAHLADRKNVHVVLRPKR